MRYLVLVLLLFLGLLQYRLWFGDGSIPKIHRLEELIAEQQQENARLLERNRALEAEVRDLKRGLEAIEERARNELGMIKEDEVFYQIVREPSQPDSP